jgi:mono/diheme cytochrome c family protein
LIRLSFGGVRPPLGGLLVAVLALSACTDFAGYDLDYALARAPFIATMRSTVAYESHTLPRLPPAGSVPVMSPAGEVVSPFTQAQLDSVGAVLTNPVPLTPEVLERGETLFRNQCFVCHGAEGQGNGPVVGNGRFPLGPTLIGGTAVSRSDGYIYGVIRVGRGLMPAYGERAGHLDRWAIVHYVRQLQQNAGTAPPPATVAAPPVEVQQATQPGQ